MRVGRGVADTLTAATRLWPTPLARDHRSGQAVKSDAELWGKKGRPLECVATTFHPSHPALPIPAGQPSSPPRRSLNPLFVEWLMGWPTGWTASAPAETGLSHWLQLMRGALSTLCSPREADQMTMF